MEVVTEQPPRSKNASDHVNVGPGDSWVLETESERLRFAGRNLPVLVANTSGASCDKGHSGGLGSVGRPQFGCENRPTGRVRRLLDEPTSKTASYQ